MKSFKITFPSFLALLICSCLSLCSYAENSYQYQSEENTEYVASDNGEIQKEEPGFFRKLWNGIVTIFEIVICIILFPIIWKAGKWFYNTFLAN